MSDKAVKLSQAKTLYDDLRERVETAVSTLNGAINASSERLDELAENGYYTESVEPEDVYIQLTSGAIANTGSTYSDISKGYIWLTSEQEALALKIDTSVYSYNLCYMNGSSVAKYTGWLTTSPIEFDDTTHTQIGINVKKTAGGNINTILDEIVYYTSGGQTEIGNLATKDYAIAKQQSVSDNGKVLGIGADGIVVPVEQSAGVDVDDTLSIAGDAADAKATGSRIDDVAINGCYVVENEQQDVYIQLTSGAIASTGTTYSDSSRGYIWLSPEQEAKTLKIDTDVYSYNICYLNGTSVAKFTSWQTTSPITFDGTVHTQIGITVKKNAGGSISSVLNEILYYTNSVQRTVGNLATKEYVNKRRRKDFKCIYPDDFISRIKPDIYFDGGYFADIDLNNYKVNGSGEVWVSPSGSDSTGTGEQDKPYLTITKALTQSVVNIHLMEGTYEQGTHYNANVNIGGKNFIGHGNVVLQNDSSGHSTIATTSSYFENITFKHGNATVNPAFYASCSGANQCICFVGCTFRDGGDNGLSVTGMDAVLVDCVSYGNRLDGFNYHDKTVSSVVYVPNVLEIDCVAYNNGSSESGSDSCNGSTAHDGAKVIRLNGEYYSCYGGVIAEIARTGEEPTISVNYGVLAHDSTGTGTYKASFWASINTKMYLYDCKSYGGTYDISAINDALIVSRRLTTGRDVPAVNVASTATVLQY